MFYLSKVCACKNFPVVKFPKASQVIPRLFTMENYELFGFETTPRRRSKRTQGAPVKNRLKGYLLAIFAKETRSYSVNFDRLAKAFSCSRRAVEMAVATLRAGDRFNFQTVRAGRSFCVQISDRNPLPSSGVFSSEEKIIQNNTARRPAQFFKKSSGTASPQTSGGWEKKAAPAKILRLGAWIARHELGRIHRAGCRTLFRVPHAANFVSEALHDGHGRAEIVSAYEYALRSVDSDLEQIPPSVRWEPSTLVKLAKRRLADGLTCALRVANRWRILNRQPVEPETVEQPARVFHVEQPGQNPALRRFNLGRALMEAVRHFGEASAIVAEIRSELALIPAQ